MSCICSKQNNVVKVVCIFRFSWRHSMHLHAIWRCESAIWYCVAWSNATSVSHGTGNEISEERSSKTRTRCSKVKDILQPTVSRPVHLAVRHPSGARNHWSSFLTIFLDSDLSGVPSLTRSRVYSFQFYLLSPPQSFLGLSPTGFMNIFFYFYFWDSPQPGGPGSCIYFPQEQGSPVIPPRIGYVAASTGEIYV
jgi:hypothetical protein